MISAQAVQTLVEAKKVGLPLEVGAQIANIAPDLAQDWLNEGRRLRTLGNTKSQHAYNQLCRDFADEYDAAGGVLVQQLRSYMLVHAARDPKACAQLLESIERDYAAHLTRRQALSAPPPIALTAEDQAAFAALRQQPDLSEPFVPLGLLAAAQTTRTAKFTQTRADGSSASAEYSEQSSAAAALEAEIEEQSDEALEYYAIHGHWPKDAPRPRQDLEEVIDALGEVVEVEPDLLELEHALAGERVVDGAVQKRSSKRPAPAQAAAPAEARPSAPPPAPPPALRRVDPAAGLRDLGPERQHVQALEQHGPPELAVPTTKVPAPPPAAPLRRVNPMDAR